MTAVRSFLFGRALMVSLQLLIGLGNLLLAELNSQKLPIVGFKSRGHVQSLGVGSLVEGNHLLGLELLVHFNQWKRGLLSQQKRGVCETLLVDLVWLQLSFVNAHLNLFRVLHINTLQVVAKFERIERHFFPILLFRQKADFDLTLVQLHAPFVALIVGGRPRFRICTPIHRDPIS